MIYVMDSGPLIVMFRHYYPDRFPTLWERFDEMRNDERLVSTREVSNEVNGQEDRLSTWAMANRPFFHTPTDDELEFVAQIFAVPHFQALIRRQARLQGRPVADPFVIAKARHCDDGCVVSTELYRQNAAKIPNVCEHFDVPHMDLETFMETENWTF